MRTDENLNHEQRSQRELLSTEVSRTTAVATSWVFVGLLVLIPLAQLILDSRQGEKPAALTLFDPLREMAERISQKDPAGVWSSTATLFSRQHLRSFEERLESTSAVRNFFQPRIQQVLTGVLGFGNHKGVVGLNGWLYYQQGVDYVIGRDLLDEDHLRVTTKRMLDRQGIDDPQPDPRPALEALARFCAGSGIHLVVLPIPDKAMIQPAQLTRRLALRRPLQPLDNAGFARLSNGLKVNGVDVFNPAPRQVSSSEIRYLRQDTHWTPRFMEETAQAVAAHVRRVVDLPATSRPVRYRTVARSVRRVGDLVDMLKLPIDQNLFRPEQIEIHQVVDNDSGRLWESDEQADVLLLGDSFTNIYSDPGMGWGEGAGLAEHLSLSLGRPVRVIAQNGGGVLGVREEWARALRSSDAPWPQVVIYEFAVRDLIGENWRSVAYPAGQPAQARLPLRFSKPQPVPVTAAVKPVAAPDLPSPASAVGELVVVGAVTKNSAVPEPNTAPYKDCLTLIKLRVEKVESGSYENGEIIAAFLAMIDNRLLPPARYSAGDRFRLHLIPLRRADKQIRSMQRADDLGDFELKPYYVIAEDKL
ncbi:MAG: hypothetical protein EHM61_23770 [Acidobacteria bacterium]|nr:MAG: hypothetical protein EHM61_23770 [Acidobacteriota bacterium]